MKNKLLLNQELERFHYLMTDIINNNINEDVDQDKLDLPARHLLQKLYNTLGYAAEDAYELSGYWSKKKDKRSKRAHSAAEAIFKAQGLLNSFAEDIDISLQ